jgi:hypothetical protein
MTLESLNARYGEEEWAVKLDVVPKPTTSIVKMSQLIAEIKSNRTEIEKLNAKLTNISQICISDESDSRLAQIIRICKT